MTDDAIAIPGYSIERKLGRGGMAAVYLAIQQSFEREVALKVMSPLLNSDPSFTTRFMREARIIAHMHHASIVPVFDVGEHQPHHYLSMEYLSGGDLKQRIVQGRCNVQFAIDVCIAVSSALDLAHRKGFVHRDVKPENVLFREDGTPVLTDFGIARAIDTGTSLTMAGMLVGTPSYMSPEQVKGLELDGRSDIYSLGIVFYEMLMGSVPFRADSTLSVALKHLTEPLPRLPGELAEFQPILDRMTAKEREARYASGAEVINALRNVEEISPDQTLIRSWHELAPKMPAAVTVAENPAAQISKHMGVDPRWLPWAGAAAAIIVLAIVAFFLGGVDKLPAPNGAVAAQTPSATAPAANPNAAATNAAGAAAAPVEPATLQNATAPEQSPPAATAAAAGEEQIEDPAFQARVAQLMERNKRLAEQKRLREERLAAKQLEQQEKQAAEQQQATELLAKARNDYAQGYMVEPEGASAADHYRAVLKLQPQNAEALAGMQRIGDVLAAEAKQSAATGNVETTGRLIALLRSVQPKHPQMEELLASLQQMESSPVALSRRQQENLDRAARYIAKAHEFLQRTPLNLRMAEAATDQYDRAAAATEVAPGLPFLKERIISAYAVAVRTELNDDEKKRALKVIGNARDRNWMSAELQQLEAQIKGQ